MGAQGYSQEFKEEAVWQVVERRRSVADVAARLGVSARIVYKWLKTVTPDPHENQTAELLDMKSELSRLRAQMRRVEEERDMLKNTVRFLARASE